LAVYTPLVRACTAECCVCNICAPLRNSILGRMSCRLGIWSPRPLKYFIRLSVLYSRFEKLVTLPAPCWTHFFCKPGSCDQDEYLEYLTFCLGYPRLQQVQVSISLLMLIYNTRRLSKWQRLNQLFTVVTHPTTYLARHCLTLVI
jgi:hypothetical protein